MNQFQLEIMIERYEHTITFLEASLTEYMNMNQETFKFMIQYNETTLLHTKKFLHDLKSLQGKEQ